MKNDHLPDYDIAVIGGGISGIYTAWRMMMEGTEHSGKLKNGRPQGDFLKLPCLREVTGSAAGYSPPNPLPFPMSFVKSAACAMYPHRNMFGPW